MLYIGALLACYDHRYGAINGSRLKVGIPYLEITVYSDPDAVEYEMYSQLSIRGND